MQPFTTQHFLKIPVPQTLQLFKKQNMRAHSAADSRPKFFQTVHETQCFRIASAQGHCHQHRPQLPNRLSKYAQRGKILPTFPNILRQHFRRQLIQGQQPFSLRFQRKPPHPLRRFLRGKTSHSPRQRHFFTLRFHGFASFKGILKYLYVY